MRDLLSINPSEPLKIWPFIGPMLLLVMGAGGIAFAYGASAGSAQHQNLLAALNIGIVVFALIMVPVTKLILMIMGWRTAAFGISNLFIGSVSLLSWNPMLCIAIYGKISPWIVIPLIGINLILTFLWAKRFFAYYENIRVSHQDFWKRLYVEEEDAIYFSQPCDKWLTQKKLKISHFFGTWATVLPMAGAIGLLPFMTEVTRWAGVPFVHIFLAIGAAPLSIMLLGISMKGFLLHYYYPWRIKRATGKNVYVDLVTPCKDYSSTQIRLG